jgi:RNA-directed DNA polymerase
MKTYKHLYPQIYDWENLTDAFYRARKGKRSRPDVAAFEFNLENEILSLHEELATQTYRPGLYHSFYIREPKRRKISAAPFRDRVVHHALCRVIEPIWEARFIYDSYACRVGKGHHRALFRCIEFVRRYRYVLKCDIKQFFPSIDHAVLRSLLARRIRDPDTMGLIDLILASGVGVLDSEYTMQWFPGDALMAALRPRGLPIGNLTSQFWANVYLHELDKFVKHSLRWPAYLRYSDDFLLFGDDKPDLHCGQVAIADFLVPLRLRLHERKCVVFPTETGVDFVGFRVYPTHLRLRRDNVRRFVRRMRRLQASYQRGEIDLGRVHASIQSWIAHSGYANTYRLRQRLFAQFIFNSPQRECNDAGITDFRQEL